MSRNDAKRALETIEILRDHNTYTEADAITIINNLMKRSYADGVQHVKGQQENAIEMWRLASTHKDTFPTVLPTDHNTMEKAQKWLDEMIREYPESDYSDYEPRLFREVMDNE